MTSNAPTLVTFQDLDEPHCRWPIGDPKRGPFGFCGAERAEWGPYCAKHQALSRAPRDASELANATTDGASR